MRDKIRNLFKGYIDEIVCCVVCAIIVFIEVAAAASAYDWTMAVGERVKELAYMGYSLEQINDQVTEEFDGVDGGYGTGGIDGKLLNGSIAPNGHLAGSGGGSSSSGSSTTEKPPHVHEYKETSRVEATCTSKGKITKTCDCGNVKTETISITPHNLEPVTGSMNPGDCQTEGTVTHACTMCGYTEIILLSKGEHDYMKDTENSIPALCESKGKNVYFCSICGNSYEEVVSETGHIWETEYTVDKEPTCTEGGFKSYHCQVCDKSSGNAVPMDAPGHILQDEAEKDATFWMDGLRKVYCITCGEVMEHKVTSATGGSYRYVILGAGGLMVVAAASGVGLAVLKRKNK